MTKTSATIVFFGNERLATGVTTQAPTLRTLIDAGYHIVCVVANQEEVHSANARELEIATVAREHQVPVLLPTRPTDIREQLQAYHADVGVLAAYGKIVPQSIIDIFPRGIVNVHPSLLPLHRGPTPIESAILEGASQTGVSIMQLVKEMDAGPIFAQKAIVLHGSETKQKLTDTLLQEGAALLLDVLPGILDGSLRPTPQKEENATYDNRLNKTEGVLDWQKPAVMLEREVRAFAHWPKSRATLAGKETVVTEAHVVPCSDQPGSIRHTKKDLIIATAKDGLAIDRLKPAGKAEMTAAAFLAGYGRLLDKA